MKSARGRGKPRHKARSTKASRLQSPAARESAVTKPLPQQGRSKQPAAQPASRASKRRPATQGSALRASKRRPSVPEATTKSKGHSTTSSAVPKASNNITASLPAAERRRNHNTTPASVAKVNRASTGPRSTARTSKLNRMSKRTATPEPPAARPPKHTATRGALPPKTRPTRRSRLLARRTRRAAVPAVWTYIAIGVGILGFLAGIILITAASSSSPKAKPQTTLPSLQDISNYVRAYDYQKALQAAEQLCAHTSNKLEQIKLQARIADLRPQADLVSQYTKLAGVPKISSLLTPQEVFRKFKELRLDTDYNQGLAMALFCFEHDMRTQACQTLAAYAQLHPEYQQQIHQLYKRKMGQSISPEELAAYLADDSTTSSNAAVANRPQDAAQPDQAQSQQNPDQTSENRAQDAPPDESSFQQNRNQDDPTAQDPRRHRSPRPGSDLQPPYSHKRPSQGRDQIPIMSNQATEQRQRNPRYPRTGRRRDSQNLANRANVMNQIDQANLPENLKKMARQYLRNGRVPGIPPEFADLVGKFMQNGRLTIPPDFMALLQRYNQNGKVGPEGLLAVANWCERHQMPAKAQTLYRRVLAIDSNNFVARKALGYVKTSHGWLQKSDAELLGYFLFKGKWVNEDELRQKGYLPYKGQWLSKEEARAKGLVKSNNKWVKSPKSAKLAKAPKQNKPKKTSKSTTTTPNKAAKLLTKRFLRLKIHLPKRDSWEVKKAGNRSASQRGGHKSSSEGPLFEERASQILVKTYAFDFELTYQFESGMNARGNHIEQLVEAFESSCQENIPDIKRMGRKHKFTYPGGLFSVFFYRGTRQEDQRKMEVQFWFIKHMQYTYLFIFAFPIFSPQKYKIAVAKIHRFMRGVRRQRHGT